MKYKVWECKIVIDKDEELPEGFDSPPRRAAIEAVERYGVRVLECFSGWDGKLDEIEERVIGKRNKCTCEEVSGGMFGPLYDAASRMDCSIHGKNR